MLLKNLIKGVSKSKNRINISGLATNSKKIKKNYIFFAIKGNKINGEKFIKEAITKGASVIICSKSCKIKDKNIMYLYVLSALERKIRRFSRSARPTKLI